MSDGSWDDWSVYCETCKVVCKDVCIQGGIGFECPKCKNRVGFAEYGEFTDDQILEDQP